MTQRGLALPGQHHTEYAKTTCHHGRATDAAARCFMKALETTPGSIRMKEGAIGRYAWIGRKSLCADKSWHAALNIFRCPDGLWALQLACAPSPTGKHAKRETS